MKACICPAMLHGRSPVEVTAGRSEALLMKACICPAMLHGRSPVEVTAG